MDKPKSKRGRKPKNKNSQNKMIVSEIDKTVPIIVHLPINLKEDKEENYKEDKKVKTKIKVDDKQVLKIDINDKAKCWWCRYSFETERVELPENYYNDYFYCIGNFCSYNCATSYNIELNDENVFKRQSLLHLQYKKIYNEYKYFKPSPSWKILEDAGGTVSIEEYRKNLTSNDYNYLYLKPPMISRIAFVEKISTKISKNSNDIILKRSKPLKSKNYNLEQTFGLKKILT